MLNKLQEEETKNYIIMAETILRIENLSHRYTKNWAIRDINIEMHSKEILGLLGSNGAGKSTTMNILCGVLNQTEGDVFINGIDLRKNPEEAKKNIGFLPQKPPVYPDLTVEEYIRHTAHLRFVPEKEIPEALEKALTKCGLTHMRKRLIRNLSGGYQQRVGIAQAIIHEPKLVVFDEPTTGLDPNNIAEIRQLIKEIGEDRAVILCTHILPEVQMICENVKMIENGKLVFSDTIDAFNDYIEPDTMVVEFGNQPTNAEIMEVEGVLEIAPKNGKKLQIKFDHHNQHVSEELIERSVKNGWKLREVAIEKQSLDLIFAHLSGKVK